jgi:hypothetical protein
MKHYKATAGLSLAAFSTATAGGSFEKAYPMQETPEVFQKSTQSLAQAAGEDEVPEGDQIYDQRTFWGDRHRRFQTWPHHAQDCQQRREGWLDRLMRLFGASPVAVDRHLRGNPGHGN